MIAAKPGFSATCVRFARHDVHPPDVMQLRVAVVEADQDLAGKSLADSRDTGMDLFDRRQIRVVPAAMSVA